MVRTLFAILLIFNGITVAADGENARYCGCPTPWATLSGPAVGNPASLQQIATTDPDELAELAEYNRLSCNFHDPRYPGHCRGVLLDRGIHAAIVGRDHVQSTDVDDMVRLVAEVDFPEGRRMAELYARSDDVRCSASPADGMMIQAFARAVIKRNFDPERLCELSEPLSSAQR